MEEKCSTWNIWLAGLQTGYSNPLKSINYTLTLAVVKWIFGLSCP